MTTQLPTIMIVDDNQIDRMLYERVIKRIGVYAEAISFAYAEDAIEYLRSRGGKVDLILLDINMPRMDGFEFLEAAQVEFSAGWSASVVIMLTTSLNPRDRDRACAFANVKDFLNKPLTADAMHDLAKLFLPTAMA